ncbi:MAG: DNA polymerase-3 subunit epsilon [Zhongshania marina]|jgi:DNA polymerase-3 subunit epsilon
MTPILFFDTETTGLPKWKEPSDSPEQPHLVQLAAILADQDTQKIISSMDVIIRPDDWEISEEMTAIHGISQEQALAVGIPEALALDMFLNLWRGGTTAAHNSNFDQRIIRIAIKRYNQNELMQEAWAVKENHFCTMRAAQTVIGGKAPKLSEAYEHFTDKVLEGAHNAMADTTACMEVYWQLMGSRVAA